MDSINPKIEKYLEDEIKNILYSETSQGFTDKVMKQAELSKKFAEEDKKVHRTVLSLSFVYAFATVLLGGLAALIVSASAGEDSEPSGISIFINNLLSEIGDAFSSVSFSSLSGNVILYAAGILFIIGGFLLAERFLFRSARQRQN